MTLLFTDVVGATALWEEHAGEVEDALVRHSEILEAIFSRHDGRIFASDNTGFGVAFEDPESAMKAAVEAQGALTVETWPGGLRLRVRMGLETGAAREHDGAYVGPVATRASRIMAAAHGGQILVGARAAALIEGAALVDLGDHRLPDLPRAERLFQVFVEGAPTRFPPPQATASYRGNLPLPADSLIGRERTVAEVVELVRTHGLVTLTGVGGVGKTRLSIEVGASLTDEHPDGVWMVEFAPLTDPGAVVDAIATTLGVTPQPGAPVLTTLVEALSGQRALLVLDNCEHLVESVARTVSALIAAAPTLHVLATSR